MTESPDPVVSPPESLSERLARVLSAEQSPLRDEGIGLMTDFLLDQKVREFVDVEAVRVVVVRWMTQDNLGKVIDRHVRPGWDQYTAHVSASQETVGALVPDPARDRIRRIVEKSRLPRAAWAEGMVDPVLMRRLFGPVWANLLLSFAKRLPIPGLSGATGAASRGASGIAERLSRSVQERAEKIVDVGRSVMGGLGAEVEKRLQSAARDFSDGAAEIWREAMKARLESAEGREIVAQMSRQVLDHVMMTRLVDLHADTESVPMHDIFAAVPEIVAHAAPRGFIQDLVSAEIAAFLAVEGDRSLREVLSEMGVLTDVRAVVTREAGKLARGFFGTDEFRDWFGRLLDA